MTHQGYAPSRGLVWVAWLVALPPVWLFITTPMGALHQGMLGLGSVLLMTLANRFRRDSRRVSLWLMLLSVMVSSRYLYWRATETLVFQSGLEMALGYGLFIAELYAWTILVLGYLQTLWPLQRTIVPLPDDMSLWPSVDVYIPTYNESLSVVMDTVLAAQNMDYPRDRMKIYLLDDGRREAFAAFAARVGVGYITRNDNQHAKAGNLNNAMRVTDGELICIFDCDHVPTRAFLQSTVGGFLTDRKLALLQTPHYFYSPDPFERNLSVAGELPREGDLFYGPVQKGNDYWNAAFFCGSCAVIRRAALNETDGFAVETVTEDAHTALKLQRMGWRTAFLGLPLAAGLATERLALHIGQRARWARGMTQIMRRDNPLFGRGLTFMQRICYLNAMLHFQFALPRVVFLTAPLAYLLLGQNVIASSASMIFAYALPHLAHAIWTNSRLTGRDRYAFWGEIYETVLAFHLIKPTLVTLLDPKRGKFNVTDKGGLLEKGMFDYHSVRPHLIVAFLLLAGVGWGAVRLFWNEYYGIERDVMLLNLFWASFSLTTLLAAIAVARERKQTRTAIRIEVALPAALYLQDGRNFSCRTADLSMGGARVVGIEGDTLSAPVEALEVRVQDQLVVVPARLVASDSGGVRLQFPEMDLDLRRRLVRVLMGRADAWLPDHEHPQDRPLRSLWAVVRAIAGLFFTSWMQAGSSAGASAPVASGSAWRWATRLALLLLVLGLVLLAVRPVLALEAEAVQAGHVTAARIITLREMGQPDGLLLRGDGSQAGVSFALRSDRLATAARLRLKIRFSTALVAQRSALQVDLNGRVLTSVPLSGRGGEAEVEIEIPPAQLITANRLNFRLQGVVDAQCHNPLDVDIWAQVEPASELYAALLQLPIANDLRVFPRPFADSHTADQQSLSVVFPEAPDADTVHAAAILASWFGAQADFRGVRFDVNMGRLPSGHALVFSTDEAPLPGLEMPAHQAPGITMMDHPTAAPYKLLVLHAPDSEGLIEAARFLAFRSDEMEGTFAEAQPVTPGERQAYDAPRWVAARAPLPLAGLTSPGALRVSGIYPGLIDISFRAAPNLFMWPGETIPLHIFYRFPEGAWLDEERSYLDVALNGEHLASLPVNRRGVLEQAAGALGFNIRQEQAIVHVAPEQIHGQNRLSFYFNQHYQPPTVCNPSLPTDVVSEIDATSYLDLSRAHYHTTLPELSHFVAAGYPFTRYADLSRTALVLPAQPDRATLAAALQALGRIGSATGLPAHNVAVALGAPMLSQMRERHLLVISPLDEPVVAAALGDGRLSVRDGRLRVRRIDTRDRLYNLLRGDWLQERRAADRALTSRTDAAGLFSQRSPFDAQRYVVLIGATDSAHLPPLVTRLGEDAVGAAARGDMVLLDQQQGVYSYRFGPRYIFGDMSVLGRLQWFFNTRPLIVLAVMAGILLLLVWLMYPRFQARERARLGQARSNLPPDQQDNG